MVSDLPDSRPDFDRIGAATSADPGRSNINTELRDLPEPWRAKLYKVWSPLIFADPAMSAYAASHILSETQRGIRLMSRTAVLFLGVAALMSSLLALGHYNVYAFSAMMLLAVYVHAVSARLTQVQALHLLSTLLLVVCGSGFVLLVQQSGQLDTMLLLSIALLFMLVPIVPWGLREAGSTVAAIYLMFTASTGLTHLRFSLVDLWVMQLLMLMAALVSLVLVGRALSLRKHDLTMRYGLEQAHNQVATLANRDYLTGAWNRRYLENDFARVVAAHHAAGEMSYFGLFDIDRFKVLNDTLGHDVGDEVLRAVARVFSDLAGENQYLVRLGGDEFVLLLHGERPLERIAGALRALDPFRADSTGLAITPTVTLGLIQMAPFPTPSFAAAYKMADELLYEAKRAGGGSIRYRLTSPQTGLPDVGEFALRSDL